MKLKANIIRRQGTITDEEYLVIAIRDETGFSLTLKVPQHQYGDEDHQETKARVERLLRAITDQINGPRTIESIITSLDEDEE